MEAFNEEDLKNIENINVEYRRLKELENEAHQVLGRIINPYLEKIDNNKDRDEMVSRLNLHLTEDSWAKEYLVRTLEGRDYG